MAQALAKAADKQAAKDKSQERQKAMIAAHFSRLARSQSSIVTPRTDSSM